MDTGDIFLTLQPLGVSRSFVCLFFFFCFIYFLFFRYKDNKNEILLQSNEYHIMGVIMIKKYRAVKLFGDTGGVADRPRSGRPR